MRACVRRWVEQDPLAIWHSVQAAMEGGMARARDAHGEVRVRAVGITNQRETTVVWDRATGAPLHNAIVWLDNRTADVCRAMARAHGGTDAFRPVTGLPVSTYFSAYKLRWLLDHVPAVAEAAAQDRLMLGTVDSWLLYKLTGRGGGAGAPGRGVGRAPLRARACCVSVQTHTLPTYHTQAAWTAACTSPTPATPRAQT